MTEPLPEKRIIEFEELAYGMFVHWGLYSLVGQGEWIRYLRPMPKEEYSKLKDQFKADKFEARSYTKLAKASGMKYITFTTRHHDGFSLYDTRGLCDFDSVHSAAKRDLIKEFVEACDIDGIIPFFYHTIIDWYQDSYKDNFDEYVEYLIKSMEILCTNYGRIGGFWFDGYWNNFKANWRHEEFFGMIRNHQPDAVIICNTGFSHPGMIYHPKIDCVTYERGRPGQLNREGAEKYVAIETSQVLNKNWGLAENDFNYKSPKDVIEQLCTCRRAGSNYLLNVGSNADGSIPEFEAGFIRKIGQWMRLYGDIIYKAKSCGVKGEGKDFILESDGYLYLFVYELGMSGDPNVVKGPRGDYPRSFTGLKKRVRSVKWLDNSEDLEFCQDISSGLFTVKPTMYPYGTDHVVRIARISC